MVNKYWWWLAVGLVVLSLSLVRTEYANDADDDGVTIEDEEEPEALVRNERAAKDDDDECRYNRGGWTECDSKTNLKSRSLTLKKGSPDSCERTKVMQKKCKRACRYEKATWTECNSSGEMTRTDLLKSSGDTACPPTRRMTKKCNKDKDKATKDKTTKPKDKGRRNRP